MGERAHDVVVFGATGFTGRLVAEYLAAHAPGPTRWAIAGRNEAKLRALVDELRIEPCPPGGFLVADVSDEASLRRMAASTKALATTVGPFARYGEGVVRACVAEATDYLDITGEPGFVGQIIDRYHEEARAKAIKVIPCCGFDSVPHDLGVLFTLDHVVRGVPLTVQGFVRARGSFSGGTLLSALEAMGQMRSLGRRHKARPDTEREVRGMKPRLRFDPALGAWAVPLPTIDPFVVLRSARLSEEYGPRFRYGHHARVRKLRTAVGGAVGVTGLFALSQLAPTRSLLSKVRPPGKGPSALARSRSFFQVTFVAEAGGERVVTEVAGGDPGYSETSKMLAESALLLSLDREATPERFGVVTPATGMGRALIERLQRTGISFRRLP